MFAIESRVGIDPAKSSLALESYFGNGRYGTLQARDCNGSSILSLPVRWSLPRILRVRRISPLRVKFVLRRETLSRMSTFQASFRHRGRTIRFTISVAARINRSSRGSYSRWGRYTCGRYIGYHRAIALGERIPPLRYPMERMLATLRTQGEPMPMAAIASRACHRDVLHRGRICRSARVLSGNCRYPGRQNHYNHSHDESRLLDFTVSAPAGVRLIAM